MAQTPKESDLTSIQERLRQFARSHQEQASTPTDTNLITERPADLLPLHGGEHIDAPEGIRFSLPDHLQLVDWTGKAVRDGKRGVIPAQIQPILQRLDLDHEAWLEIVQHFRRCYCLAAGAMDRLQQFGEQPGRYWLQGVGSSRRLYHHQGETLIAQPEAAHDQAHSWQAL